MMPERYPFDESKGDGVFQARDPSATIVRFERPATELE
jgi:hypothetical protein